MKRVPLLLILLLALVVRLYGLDFGLPNHQHVYPYNPDEWTPLQAFKAMNPARLDFNPHFFFDPTLQYYLVAGGIAVGHLTGWLRANGSERWYFEHPESLARMIWIGRLEATLWAVLTVYLIYLLARRAGLGRGFALLAALLLALHPSHIIHSHFMTVNTAVTFWIVACFLGMESWIRRGGLRNILWVGIAAGFAISTKYSGALLLPFLGLAGFLRFRRLREATPAPPAAPEPAPLRRALRETAAVGALATLAFVAGTPYSVLAFKEMMGAFHEVEIHLAAGSGDAVSPVNPLWNVLRVHLFSSTPPLLLLALGGLLPLARRGPRIVLPILGWIGAFIVISFNAGALATDSRFLPLSPFLAIAGAFGLASLWRWRGSTGPGRPLAMAALLLTLACLGIADAAYLGRFVGPMPQEEASAWARAHLRDAEKVVLAGSPIYFYPDLPARELLQPYNAANYRRETTWTVTLARSVAEGLAQNPDAIFLTVWQPRRYRGLAWLREPGYRVAATFPGKVRFFGRRVPVPLDLYDTDIWILVRKER